MIITTTITSFPKGLRFTLVSFSKQKNAFEIGFPSHFPLHLYAMFATKHQRKTVLKETMMKLRDCGVNPQPPLNNWATNVNSWPGKFGKSGLQN